MNKKESASLRFLYGTALGRLLLRPLVSRTFSKISGAFLSSRFSKPLIATFVKRNGIDLNDYYSDDFRSFNDCFVRRIREELRPVDMDPDALAAPCDGLLSVYPINDGTVIPIKQSRYSISSFLGGDGVADRFRKGFFLVFRLCVHNYHRYVYFDDGEKGENVFLPGKLHTVRPIALEAGPVFTENCREYTIIESEHFGLAVQAEVGAMLVGKISNLHGAGTVRRGEEKGMFLYGGSTVVLLLEEGAADIREDLLESSARGEEVSVILGERIGTRMGSDSKNQSQEEEPAFA